MDWRLFLKILVVSTFISGAVGSLFLYPIKDAGHVAAWVQALGAILALVVAIGLATKERSLRRMESREKLRNSVRSLLESIVAIQRLAGCFYRKEIIKPKGSRDSTNYSGIFESWNYVFKTIYLNQPVWIECGLIASLMQVSAVTEELIGISRSMGEGNGDEDFFLKEFYFSVKFLEGSKKKIKDFAVSDGLMESDTNLYPMPKELEDAFENLRECKGVIME